MIHTSGEQIYKYRLDGYIGGGNFGEVWTADDISLKSRCAIKLLHQANTSIDERLLEAQIGNRLQHPNVVNIKYADIVQYGEPLSPIVVIAMPFYPNGSVLSQLNSGNFLDLDKSIKCLLDVLRGLEYLHENGYYHCDIKPNNILVGNMGEYLLSDYGITCFSPTHTAVNPRQCYLPHTSPETISNNIYDIRTDIYQLGLTAFRLINGVSEIKSEFLSDRSEFAKTVLGGKVITDAKYRPYVPRSIRRIINKAVALNPGDRYQSALEMRRDLERIMLKGNCTADEHGNVLLINKGNSYRYEVVPTGKTTSNLTAYKCNLTSGRETRVKDFCKKGLRNKDIKQIIQKFCLEQV
jgi:serine/threonine protein kinase